MNDQFAQIRDHFLAALECDGLKAQLRYVQKHCTDNPELRAKLEEMLEAHHDSGVGSAATTCADEAIDRESSHEGLVQDFFCAGYVSRGANRIGSATRDHIAFPSLGSQLVGNLLHLLHHVRAAGDHFDALHAQKLEQKIVAAC